MGQRPAQQSKRRKAVVGLPGSDYATDGAHLFRVVTRFAAGEDGAGAALEDCMTLEVRQYSVDELGAMRLRPVHTRKAAA